MASTVKAELDKANPSNLAALERLAKIGAALATIARTERVVVAANIGVLPQPARALLSVYAVTGGATGELDIIKREGAIVAGDCTINELGNVDFAAADAVTLAEIIYIPIEEDLVTEDIPVTAAGVGTFNDAKACAQIVSATLNAPAATPGAKTPAARGTAVPGAGGCAIQDDNTTIQFVAAEAGVACTATVSYHAFPGVGVADEGVGGRLDAAYTPV